MGSTCSAEEPVGPLIALKDGLSYEQYDHGNGDEELIFERPQVSVLRPVHSCGSPFRSSTIRTLSVDSGQDEDLLATGGGCWKPHLYGDNNAPDEVGEAEWQVMQATMRNVVGIGAPAPESKRRGHKDKKGPAPQAIDLMNLEVFRELSREEMDLELERDDAFEAIRNGSPLYALPERLRSDKEVVLAAIAREGAYCFDYITSRELREKDRDVVLALVDSDGVMLEHASEELKADKQVVLAAVRTHADAVSIASQALQADKDVKARASARGQEEQRLLKYYASKACGPGIASCLPR